MWTVEEQAGRHHDLDLARLRRSAQSPCRTASPTSRGWQPSRSQQLAARTDRTDRSRHGAAHLCSFEPSGSNANRGAIWSGSACWLPLLPGPLRAKRGPHRGKGGRGNARLIRPVCTPLARRPTASGPAGDSARLHGGAAARRESALPARNSSRPARPARAARDHRRVREECARLDALLGHHGQPRRHLSAPSAARSTRQQPKRDERGGPVPCLSRAGRRRPAGIERPPSAACGAHGACGPRRRRQHAICWVSRCFLIDSRVDRWSVSTVPENTRRNLAWHPAGPELLTSSDGALSADVAPGIYSHRVSGFTPQLRQAGIERKEMDSVIKTDRTQASRLI